MWKDSYGKFSPVSQAVLKVDSQSEFDLYVSEVADFFDIKFVPILLDGDLQIIMGSQLSFHHANAWKSQLT